MEIKKRSKGYVDSKYYEEKAKLMKKRKKGFCIICGKKLKGKRRKYCSDKCFENWFKQFNPPFLWNRIRAKAFRRDKYTCRRCGKTEKQLDEWYENASKYPNRKIVADHIIPIALGGDEWDLKNIQTLCVDCNAIKTREDAKKIARFRRGIKDMGKIALDRKISEFLKKL